MKVATWNVNGIRARLPELTAWAERRRPDVLCLQEIKCSSNEIPEPLTTLSEYWSYWHGQGGYSGVSLHLRRTTFARAPRFSHPTFDHETRIVQAELDGLVFASVYVPNGGKDYAAKLAFLQQLSSYVAELVGSGKQLVLAGDMNVTRTPRDVHPNEQKPRAIGQRPDERALFETVLAAGVVDVCRTLHPEDDRFFTWWPFWNNARHNNVGWRLDYVLAAEPLARVVTRVEVERDVGKSDHGPVVATFDVGAAPPP